MDASDRSDPDAELAEQEQDAERAGYDAGPERETPELDPPAMTFRGSADDWRSHGHDRAPALGYVGVALLAGTIGATLGILLAPDSGRNTRRRIRRRASRERQALERRAKRVMAEAEDYIEDRLAEAAKYIERQARLGASRAADVAGDVAEGTAERIKEGRKRLSRILK